tara:strand:+ start:127 stop:651 length:525 start_codon:yes stop_codon:yes gene_type:complete
MGKNLQKVKDMVEGKFGGFKTQVGFGDQEVEPIRKVGDTWTDSDGYKWEQKEGYKLKLKSTPNVGIFHQQCEDCERNCSLEKRHRVSFIKFKKCFYCQMNFEFKLKSFPGKWEAWVRLQQLNNMDAIERDLEQALDDWAEEDKKKIFDESVSNALANWETEQQIDYNKKLTGQK